MSMDTLLNNDAKPLTLALNKFWNISLVSLYSNILSSEEIDLINVTELDNKQERKLKKTITQLINFKKKKKKIGSSSLAAPESTFSKIGKSKSKPKNIATDLDHLFSCDVMENQDVFKAISKNLTMTRNMRFLQFCAVRLGK